MNIRSTLYEAKYGVYVEFAWLALILALFNALWFGHMLKSIVAAMRDFESIKLRLFDTVYDSIKKDIGSSYLRATDFKTIMNIHQRVNYLYNLYTLILYYILRTFHMNHVFNLPLHF